MPSTIDCPSCTKKLRVPDELLGKQVRCPTCGTQFIAELPPSDPLHQAEVVAPPPEPPAATQPQPIEDDRPWEQPYRAVGVRRDCEPHRGVLILVLGILSLVIGGIGIPMGIAAWVMGHGDLKKMRAKQMDPEGMGLTQAGWICGMIGACMHSLICCGVGLFYAVLIFSVVSAASTMPPGGVAPAPPPPPVKRNFSVPVPVRPPLVPVVLPCRS